MPRSMLDYINRDRRDAGLSPVEWDDTAALAAARHADDMGRRDYFSHWSPEGYGPDHRYGQLGGLDVVMENVFTFYERYSDGRPVPVADWKAVLERAQHHLMQSPGHRSNILDPHHTHVGVGVAYKPRAGQIWLAQEFVNRYLEMRPLPKRLKVGEICRMAGRALPKVRDPLVNLAYEPFPAPLSPSDLENKGTYRSAAFIYEPLALRTDSRGAFDQGIRLDYGGRAGLYHVRVWVDVDGFSEKVPAADGIVEVA